MSTDFETDLAIIFGTHVNLHVTKSGHYKLPLTPATQLLADNQVYLNVKITVIATTNLSKHKQTLKQHWQFAHSQFKTPVNTDFEDDVEREE